jgi:hypothetical protein
MNDPLSFLNHCQRVVGHCLYESLGIADVVLVSRPALSQQRSSIRFEERRHARRCAAGDNSLLLDMWVLHFLRLPLLCHEPLEIF